MQKEDPLPKASDTWYLLKWQTIVSTFTLLDQEVFNSCVFVVMFVQAHQHLLFGNSELKSNNFLSRATYYQSLPEGKSPDLQLTKYHAKKKVAKSKPQSCNILRVE